MCCSIVEFEHIFVCLIRIQKINKKIASIIESHSDSETNNTGEQIMLEII